MGNTRSFIYILTADQLPATHSAWQAILLQSLVFGPSFGLSSILQLSSETVLYTPCAIFSRHNNSRICIPRPQVFEHGLHDDRYQLLRGIEHLLLDMHIKTDVQY